MLLSFIKVELLWAYVELKLMNHEANFAKIAIYE